MPFCFCCMGNFLPLRYRFEAHSDHGRIAFANRKSTLILAVLLLLITPILWINPVRFVEQNINILFLNGRFYKIIVPDTNTGFMPNKKKFSISRTAAYFSDYQILQSKAVPMETSITTVDIAID